MVFKVDREEAESIGWNSGNPGESPGSCETFHQGFMILSVLMDIRDLLTPQAKATEEFNPKKYPNDLGAGKVDFCTDKAAFIEFADVLLGKLFVPFSRMPPGIQEKCEAGESFTEFSLGDWMYDRLKKQAEEDREGKSDDRSGSAPGPGPGLDDDDIPF